jgi:predicted secreted protein
MGVNRRGFFAALAGLLGAGRGTGKGPSFGSEDEYDRVLAEAAELLGRAAAKRICDAHDRYWREHGY